MSGVRDADAGTTPVGDEAEVTGVLVLANHGVDRSDLDAATDRLATYTATDVVITEGAGECRDALDDVRGRRLVVAGGDGTLTNIVGLLRHRGELGTVTVGLLPLGTGNDFARTLGIPLDPVEAADIAAGARVRRVDVLVDDGDGVVVNAVHAGIGAEAAQASEPYKDLLGPVAYPLGAAIAGGSFHPVAVRVEVDGGTVFDGDLIMVGVGNGRSIGGGTLLMPLAEPDDGALDVVVVAAATMGQKVAFGAALASGTHLDLDRVSHWRGRQVRMAGAALRHNADGEVSEPRAEASYHVEPRVLTIAAPQSGPQSRPTGAVR